jgi:NitT/TauT family transport system permease protein
MTARRVLEPRFPWLLHLVTIGLALVAWQTLGGFGVAHRRLLATLLEVLDAVRASPAAMLADTARTTGRALLGLLLGVLFGTVAGLGAAGLARRLPLLGTFVEFWRSVPPVVVLPGFLLVLGFNDGAKILTVAFGCAGPMALAAMTLSARPPSARREMLDVAGWGAWRARSWIEPWESLPALGVAVRTSASTAVIVTVVTEMVAGGDSGLGARLVIAQVGGSTGEMTAVMLAAGGLGFAVNAVFRWFERWARRSSGLERS